MTPVYGITQGDSSGIGPEILLKAYAGRELRPAFVVYGDERVLDYYIGTLGYNVRLRLINAPSEYEPEVLNVIVGSSSTQYEITPGRLNRESGAAAREHVIQAARAALAGKIAAMVTLPMNKESTQLSDPGFVGHTELIGEVCGATDVTMMLASDELIVTHVSTHVSLVEAIARVKKDRICNVIRLTSDALRRIKSVSRIAVAGLNPHAGENGLFGDEEAREIRPAVEWARNNGMKVEGPFPPDTVFYAAVRRKQFDAIVCMYHDQGHVPMKLLDFEGSVNVELGLPIIRTSVDHGTAFDIAGKGIASTKSLVKALEFATRLVDAHGA